jgi:predicted RNase H-like HicB family nuclease
MAVRVLGIVSDQATPIARSTPPRYIVDFDTNVLWPPRRLDNADQASHNQSNVNGNAGTLVVERAMLTRYMNAALVHAHYELLSEEEGYYASIPELPGVWGNGETIEATRDDLREALEGWIALALQRGVPIPEIDGVGLAFMAA